MKTYPVYYLDCLLLRFFPKNKLLKSTLKLKAVINPALIACVSNESRQFPLVRFGTCGSLYFPPTGINFFTHGSCSRAGNCIQNLKEENNSLHHRDTHATNAG